MTAEVLTSDRLNYLIWRYLQETGHGEAAAKLQRDWTSDPQRLACASHIRPHALIVLVQKGLQYYKIEQSIVNQNHHGARSSLSASTFFFGPPADRTSSTLQEDGSEKDGADTSRNFPLTRKHGRENSATSLPLDGPSSAPPAKRSRRGTGTETAHGDRPEQDADGDSDSVEDPSSGPFVQEPPEPISNGQSPTAESIAAATVAADENGMEDGDGGGMEVDDDDGPATEFEHAPASVDALVPVRMSRTLTNGQSVGVQSDKVADLGPETITLAVRDTNVMHTVWNPQHADILAAGGQALCRIWSIARSPVHPTGNVAPISDAQPPLMEPPQPPQPPQPPDPSEPPQPPEPPEPGQAEISAGNRDSDHHQGRDPPPRPDPWRSVDLLDPPDPDAMVTTMAWSPDGEILAIAMQTDITESTSTVKLLSKSGELIDELPSAHDMVLKFAWNPSGTHLLLVTCSGQDSGTVVVWNVQAAWALPPLSLDHVIVDAAWADDGSFGLCGQNIVLEAVIDGDAIVTRHSRTEFGGDLQWTHIQIDALAHTTAVSAEECATLGIIDDSGELHRTKAHDAEITALVLQPVPRASSTPLASSRLLVTSSLDGTIKLWDIRNPFTTLHVLSLGLSSPALAISFTPDGHLLAAAHWHRILVWNAESGGLPMASWKGEASKWPHLANGVDKDSGIGEEEDGSTHSLHWDADGKRLAYGLGGQIAVINVQR